MQVLYKKISTMGFGAKGFESLWGLGLQVFG